MPGPYDSEWWYKTEAELRAGYPRFYHNLQARYPSLTSYEINLCTLLLVKNLTSGDRAEILGITVDSLRTACHRLRRRICVPDSEKLFAHLLAIAEWKG